MFYPSDSEKLVNGKSSDAFIEYADGEESDSDELFPEKKRNSGVLKSNVADHQRNGDAVSPGEGKEPKNDDASKTVTFFNVTEVYDLNSDAPNPVNVPLTEPVKDDKPTELRSPDQSGDSPAVLTVTHDLSHKPDSDTKDETPSESADQSGHRHFDVVNVDESALKKEAEETRHESHRPTLLKVASATSDGFSGQSNISANQDTIGPLDNPDFLKRLQYSVSQAVDDDGFGNANLDLEEFVEIPQTVPDLDGGWAWVVLTAAFCSLGLTGATTFTAGVLMSAILEQIDPDITKASWIGAVHISVLCMSGPFVGIVLSRLGSRWTVFCAGLILSSGMVGASFSRSIIQLIFTHGLIAGIGSGFILNTMFVTVGQYFNRYRGLACGLLATGSGAGMLIGGNALNILFRNFGLSGTYLLWGGITSHILIFALLLRPSPEERLRNAEKKMKKDPDKFAVISQQDLRSGRNSIVSGLNSTCSGADQNSIFSRGVRKVQRYPSKLSKGDVSVAPLLKAVLHQEMSRSNYSIATNRSHKSQIKNPPTSPGQGSKFTFGPANPVADALSTSVGSSPGTTPMSHSPLTTSPLVTADHGDVSSTSKQNQDSVFLSASTLGPNEEQNQLQPSSPSGSQAPTEYGPPFRRRFLSQSSQAQSQYSIGRLSQRTSIREQLQRNELDNESLASTLVSHLQPRDALTPRHKLGSRSISSMMGSIASFPTALAIVKDDLARLEATDDLDQKRTIKDHLLGFLDSLRLLKNKPFLVFITTTFLWAFGESPFTMYLPAYAISKGTSVTQASSLYTGMGFGSMCGRFLSGLVASDSGVGPILLHIGCLSIGGLVIALAPLVSESYIQQMICAGLFGFYTGSLVPLSSLITIELLGIGELGLGFGFLSLFQGVGYLLGPPVGGVFVKLVGYANALSISGCIVISASLLAMVIPILLRNAPEAEDDRDSLEDLERALRRISASDSNEGSEFDVNEQEEQHTQKLLPAGNISRSTSSLKKKDDGVGGELSPRDGSYPIKEEPLEVIQEVNPTELAPIAEEAEKKSLGDLD